VGKPSTLLAKCWEIFCLTALLRLAKQAGPFSISYGEHNFGGNAVGR
jgi:hypothetical protein